MTSGSMVGVLPQQQRARSSVLYPWLLKGKILPRVRHFSVYEERTERTVWEPKHLPAAGGSPEECAITLTHLVGLDDLTGLFQP